ncbi:MAG: hypothetical protein KME31_34820 [Tolypothrix carrinoi HA7290-LM1]|jgi:hypothetical protein|nr:hypothetical protein [Tolypothrix carrinoi HA7290-LM1]
MNPITNSTLNILIAELGTECAQVQALINQLQLPSLTANQQAEILAELLAAAVHLHTHCVRIQVRGIDKCDISGGISQLWKKTCL